MTTLFDANLCDRDFSTAAVRTIQLRQWAAGAGLHVPPTVPSIGDFEVVQLEAFLCALERGVASLPDSAVLALAERVQGGDGTIRKLIQDDPRAARWQVGADVHQQWRGKLAGAIESGALQPFDCFNGLPPASSGTAASMTEATEPPARLPAARKKRRSWLEVAGPYVAKVLRSGQYATVKELYRALEQKAGPESPFERGTGPQHGSLFLREEEKTVSLKTLQNNWASLRELARE